MIKTTLSGFVVTVHSGLYEQNVGSLGLTALGLDFMFNTHTLALWPQTHPEQVKIP